MPFTVTRDNAIKALVEAVLKEMPETDRAETLFYISSEDWSDNDDWKALNPKLRNEIETDDPEDPEHERFDAAISIYLARGYRGATNEYLLCQVQKIVPTIQSVEGQTVELKCCPCCGRKTLEARGDFEICPVCWWEDDGQDNRQISPIDEAFGGSIGGPNRVGLAIARYNFILHGISEPERTDLMSEREPREKYEKGRTFRFDPDRKVIWEENTDWAHDLTHELT